MALWEMGCVGQEEDVVGGVGRIEVQHALGMHGIEVFDIGESRRNNSAKQNAAQVESGLYCNCSLFTSFCSLSLIDPIRRSNSSKSSTIFPCC